MRKISQYSLLYKEREDSQISTLKKVEEINKGSNSEKKDPIENLNKNSLTYGIPHGIRFQEFLLADSTAQKFVGIQISDSVKKVAPY